MKRIKNASILFLLSILLLTLSACRVRTGPEAPPSALPDAAPSAQGASSAARPSDQAPAFQEEFSPPDISQDEPADDFSSETKENPQAERKEYDEQANVEFLPEAERPLAQKGEGSGKAVPSEEIAETAPVLQEEAEKTALRKIPAEEADRMGISEEAEEAESAFSYYTVLLQDGLSSLFECKRLNVYLETASDYVTVYRTSKEHRLILESGCYDVASRLTEERLRIDDSWVVRKNPDIIVKLVDASLLGPAVHSAAAAGTARAALFNRTGWAQTAAVRSGKVLLFSSGILESAWLRLLAELVLAKTAYPEVFVDLDLLRAQQMLSQEATGLLSDALYFDTGE